MIFTSKKLVAGALLVASPAFASCSQEPFRSLPDVPNIASPYYPPTDPTGSNDYIDARQQAIDSHVNGITRKLETIKNKRNKGEYLVALYCKYGQQLQSELKVAPDRALNNFDIRSTAIRKVYGEQAVKHKINDLGDFYKTAYASCPDTLPIPRNVPKQNG